MSNRVDYEQVAAKLDCAAVEKNLAQLAERKPPKKRKTVADALEPLLALHRKGWSSAQLCEELKGVPIPVIPARMRERRVRLGSRLFIIQRFTMWPTA